MANPIWTDGLGTHSFTGAGNWAAGTVPIDADQLTFDQQAGGSLTANISQTDLNAKSFKIFCEEGFTYGIGASGNPLRPEGIDTLIFKANTLNQCWFGADANNIDHVYVDTASTVDALVNLQDTIDRITLLRGSVSIVAGATITGRVALLGSGNGLCSLVIPAGVTISNLEISIKGGSLSISTPTAGAGVTIYQSGGTVTIDGTTALARLEQTGGTFNYGSTGTLTYVQVDGGTFVRTTAKDATITELHQGQDGLVDFRVGGLLLTLTGGVRATDSRRVLWPTGSKLTCAA